MSFSAAPALKALAAATWSVAPGVPGAGAVSAACAPARQLAARPATLRCPPPYVLQAFARCQPAAQAPARSAGPATARIVGSPANGPADRSIPQARRHRASRDID